MIFGLAALPAIALFEIQTDSLSAFGILVLVPYVAFVVAMSLLAFGLSGWYLPETGHFEAVAIPIIVTVASAAVAGIAFAVAILTSTDPESWKPVNQVREVLENGIYFAIMFIYTAWPALLPSTTVASFVLSRRFGRAFESGAA